MNLSLSSVYVNAEMGLEALKRMILMLKIKNALAHRKSLKTENVEAEAERHQPDIAPSDYHLFRSMTHGLAELHFHSYEDAKILMKMANTFRGMIFTHFQK